MILTSHAEAFLLDKIIKTIEPKGLLVKSDFTADEFLLAFEQMLNNQSYISKTVRENVSELHSQNILFFLLFFVCLGFLQFFLKILQVLLH